MVRDASDKLYQDLLSLGIEVILDDRGERPGAMFADWELIGVPYRVVIGERGLKDGHLEFQARTDVEASAIPVGDVAKKVADLVKAQLAS
jgi:prolyl-tRNA synthetase